MKYKLGQYFTKNELLQQTVCNLIKNDPAIILEPSIGRGDLICYCKSKLGKDIVFDMYEIDDTIELLNCINSNNVNYKNFLLANIERTYTTIIGNPPYIKKRGGNLYIDFIERCFNLLEDNGELIFIVPSDFFKVTSAHKLINSMMSVGNFTDIYHPNNEHLFENAHIDIIIFRFCKNINLTKNPTVLFNGVLHYIINTDGVLNFNKNHLTNMIHLKDVFDIYVGIVSGKDSVFKNVNFGNINVLTGNNQISSYILIDDYPCDDATINNYLLEHKEELLLRKIKSFNESNWYQWGALRNIKVVNNNLSKPCIYVYNLTRNEHVAFISTVQFFGGNLLMMLPKKDIELIPIVDYLNTNVKPNYTYSNRFKIGHKELSNVFIPKNIL